MQGPARQSNTRRVYPFPHKVTHCFPIRSIACLRVRRARDKAVRVVLLPTTTRPIPYACNFWGTRASDRVGMNPRLQVAQAHCSRSGCYWLGKGFENGRGAFGSDWTVFKFALCLKFPQSFHTIKVGTVTYILSHFWNDLGQFRLVFPSTTVTNEPPVICTK